MKPGKPEDPGKPEVSKEKVAAQETLQAAHADVERHALLLDEMRKRIKTARSKGPQVLRASAEKASSEMLHLEAQIGRDKALAKRRKQEIDEWQHWYQQQPAIERSAEWAKLESEVRWRLAEISELEQRIAGGEQARLQSFGELEAIQQDLIALETGIGERKVEADPRIAFLVQARKIAEKRALDAEEKFRRAK